MVAHKLFSTALVALALGIAALGAVTVEVNLTDTYGYAGVVGFKAEGMNLSCGGRYQPEKMVVFHDTAPCGSTLIVINPATGQSAKAIVVNQNVMFNPQDSRITDISPAVATAIGINPHGFAATRIVVRNQFGWAPVLPHLIKEFAFKNTEDLNKREFTTLTNNLLGECGNCSPLGMVAVAQVTQNRVNTSFNGQTTIYGVVNDKHQFSWVKLNPHLTSAQPRKAQAQTIASLFMLGRLSGDALAVQYQITDKATHYYAPKLINAPVWTRNLQAVRLPRQLEAELRHRFYAQRSLDGLRVASR